MRVIQYPICWKYTKVMNVDVRLI